MVLPAPQSPPATEPQSTSGSQPAPEPQSTTESQTALEPQSTTESQPAPESQPNASVEIPQFSITVVNGESSRTFTSGTSSSGKRPNTRRTIRIVNSSVNGGPPITTNIRSGDHGGDPPQRPVPDLSSLQAIVDRLRERLHSRSRSRSPGRRQTFADTEPFYYEHSRDPENTRKHFTVVPSWGVRAEDRRGPCNVCFEENSHLQIKCRRCSNQVVCCNCIIGVYRFINPCPMCRNKGEE